MNIYETFATPEFTDSSKEFPLGAGAFITLLPTAGEKSKRDFQKLMAPFAPRLKAGGELTKDEVKDINVTHFVNTIVTGWRGFKDKDGHDIPYSKENVRLLISDPKLEKFFDIIAKIANNEASFAEAQAEEDAGN